ncbi:MAG: hypothetical protein C0P75_000785 [Bacilli bacterium]|uniref:Uncharacterized protein n=1 Tax=Ureibacillus suwonensis TaxID=313007 RepID=A0ABW0RFL1_9BACL
MLNWKEKRKAGGRKSPTGKTRSAGDESPSRKIEKRPENKKKKRMLVSFAFGSNGAE